MDALIAYAKAKDIEKLYDHYHKHFLEFLEERTGFYLPFDLELACNYYEKTILSKGAEPRQYNLSGCNRAVYDILDRCLRSGKKVKFLSKQGDTDIPVDMEFIKSKIDSGYSMHAQYFKGRGQVSYDKDFSYGAYNIEFVD